MNYAFSSAAVRSVNVTLIVTGAGSSMVGALAKTPLASGCTPTQVVSTQLALLTNFSVPDGLPVPLKYVVTDNCGNPAANAQLTISFSNGDTPVTLAPVDTVSGIFAGTWVPLTQSPQVTVTALAIAPGLLTGTSKSNGQVQRGASPILSSNAVLSVYNPLIGGAIAPGSILQIYGSGLAPAAVTASQLPLSATLGNTSVTIGGLPAPLYYVSPGQINAQAPLELTPGNQYQVVVNTGGASTAPGNISVSSVQPGIAEYPNGQIIAQHLDGSLVSEASPAKPGTDVVLYLAGLGLTDVPVADGAASPAKPLAHPLVQPTLTLNGVSQPYQFVGLTPGTVGLYQINFLVPVGPADGDIVLAVTQSGKQSNTVILPVHQ
ncbi:MAG TPA: IPT/TIG domain-containing protein [Bryobacteraceae bacterium]|nr:IPT/TIG domain-containing protein [Bryobacteraceae bacterium]